MNKYIRSRNVTLFKTKIDGIDTPFKTKSSENHTLSGHTSPLRPHKGVPPPRVFTMRYFLKGMGNILLVFLMEFIETLVSWNDNTDFKTFNPQKAHVPVITKPRLTGWKLGKSKRKY